MTEKVVKLKRVRNKRITVDVSEKIDSIRTRVFEDTGVSMTYVQTFDYLINYYMKHCNEPRTKWVGIK